MSLGGMFGDMQSDVCARSAQQVLPAAKRRGGQFRRGIPAPSTADPSSLASFQPEPALQITGVERLGDTVDQAAAGLGVGVPGRLTLAAHVSVVAEVAVVAALATLLAPVNPVLRV